MSKEIFYTIFVPGGNDTAFVYGIDFTKEERKIINDLIMKECPNVEQVGFLGAKEQPELIMAGGEFCGNATRSAVYYYLNGQDGRMTLKVNEKDYIEAGVKDGKAWCQIPINTNKNIVEKISKEGIYKVQMEGMTTLVLLEEFASKYLNLPNKDKVLKETAMEFIREYSLLDSEAVGVMFLEKVQGNLKINPIVWVNSIDTLFYETACGSGTTATAIVKSTMNENDFSIDVIQPSGYIINATIHYNDSRISKAIIAGEVVTDNIKRKIVIN